jgi:hypothetical protein
MPQHNWTSLAADKFGGKNCPQIYGCGRWALKAENGDVHLYPRESQALASAPFYDSKVIDLMPTAVPEHCVDVYDVEEARRERRERRHGL